MALGRVASWAEVARSMDVPLQVDTRRRPMQHGAKCSPGNVVLVGFWVGRRCAAGSGNARLVACMCSAWCLGKLGSRSNSRSFSNPASCPRSPRQPGSCVYGSRKRSAAGVARVRPVWCVAAALDVHGANQTLQRPLAADGLLMLSAPDVCWVVHDPAIAGIG